MLVISLPRKKAKSIEITGQTGNNKGFKQTTQNTNRDISKNKVIIV